MPLAKVLIDSSFLYALFDHDDAKHEVALTWAMRHEFQPVVPQVILTEVLFLVDRSGGVPATLQFLDHFTAGNYVLESATISTLRRVREIRETYVASRLALSIAASWRSRKHSIFSRFARLIDATSAFSDQFTVNTWNSSPSCCLSI